MMEVTVENGSGLERRLSVAIPETDVDSQVQSRLQSMTRTVKIPGFRPGKVPLKVVTRRYGSAVRDEVVVELVRTSFQDAVSKENLRPTGTPTIDPLEANPGEGLAYTAIFEVFPDVSVTGLENIVIKRPQAAVTDDDVSRMLETLRRRHKSWQPTDRAALDVDRVTLNFDGLIDGEVFEGGRGEGVSVELSERRFIDGFEQGLVGARAGETRTLDLKFPDDYHASNLAGKPVSFNVEVTAVEEAVLPDVDEEFATRFGVKEGGVEALRREVSANMERELENAVRARVKAQVMDGLLLTNSVEVPNSLIAQEVEDMVRQQGAELASKGLDPAAMNLEPSVFEDAARRRLALGLILADIVKTAGLTPAADKVRARVNEIATTYDDANAVVAYYYGDKSRLAEVESSVVEDQVVEWVLERAKVETEPASFDALLNPGQTNPG